jgi:hypothetical protein
VSSFLFNEIVFVTNALALIDKNLGSIQQLSSAKELALADMSVTEGEHPSLRQKNGWIGSL